MALLESKRFTVTKEARYTSGKQHLKSIPDQSALDQQVWNSFSESDNERKR